MAEHKYARGAYMTISVPPDTTGVLEYRVWAKINGQERVVRENQLARLMTRVH